MSHKTTVRIPNHLYRHLEDLMASEGITLSQAVKLCISTSYELDKRISQLQAIAAVQDASH